MNSDATQPESDVKPRSEAKPVDTQGLASLFAKAANANSDKAAQPWQQRGNTSHHEKRIGMAPRGTRRSMGKR